MLITANVGNKIIFCRFLQDILLFYALKL